MYRSPNQFKAHTSNTILYIGAVLVAGVFLHMVITRFSPGSILNFLMVVVVFLAINFITYWIYEIDIDLDLNILTVKKKDFFFRNNCFQYRIGELSFSYVVQGTSSRKGPVNVLRLHVEDKVVCELAPSEHWRSDEILEIAKRMVTLGIQRQKWIYGNEDAELLD